MTSRRRPAGSATLGLAAVAAVAAVASTATAAETERGLEIGWLAFGDLYHVPSYHDEAGEGASGLVLRRAYLTFDAQLGAGWFGRLRFEANQAGEFEEYDVEADVKDLYLGRDFGEHRLVLGLAPTPTFDLIEDAWGLRYLAKTPLDLQGVASRDTGVALRGPLSADGTLAYRLMVGTGTEFGTESGDGRKFMGAVSWRPHERWTLDLYADTEELAGPADRRTLQAFLGYGTDALRWGLQYSHQDREDDPPLELASAFVVAQTSRRASVILRVDRLLEPSPKGDDIDYLPFDPSADATMVIAGWEFRPGERYALTPNVVVKRYERNEAGERPDTDVHLRVTAFLDFE